MDCSETENGWFDFKGYLTSFGNFLVKKFDFSEIRLLKIVAFCKIQTLIGNLISCNRLVPALELMSPLLIPVPRITWHVVVTSTDSILAPVAARSTLFKNIGSYFLFKFYFLR